MLSFDDLQDWDEVSGAVQRFLDLEPVDLAFEQLNQKSAPPPKALAWLLNRPSDLRTRIGDSVFGPVLAPILARSRKLAAKATTATAAADDPVPSWLVESWAVDLAETSELLGRDLTHWSAS